MTIVNQASIGPELRWLKQTAGVSTGMLPNCFSINQKLLQQFSKSANKRDVVRSHYFGGRHENIYLKERHVPEIAVITAWVEASARRLLNEYSCKLRVGYWFNEMKPGHVTHRHHHDEEDELLSGVYYVRVPDQSGDLVVNSAEDRIRIQPKEGMLVFFPPALMHEALENKSAETRLSVGFNVGSLDAVSGAV